MIMTKDSNGNYVKVEDIKQQDSFNGISPIEFKGSGENLENYRIYGNTMNGESIGDRTDNIIRDYIVIQTQAQYANVLFIDAELIPNTTYSFICLLNDSELRLYVNENLFNTVGYVKNGNVLKVIVKTLPELSDSQKINGKWIILKNSVTEPVIPQLSNIMMIKGSEMPEIYEPYGYRVPVKVEGKNLLQNTATSWTINGLTFTVNNDGSITCNGKRESTSTFFTIGSVTTSGETILNGCPNGGSSTSFSMRVYSATVSNPPVYYDTGNSLKLSNPDTYNIDIKIQADNICNNLTFYPMIRHAKITDGTYEPYHDPIITNLYLPEQIKKVGDEAEYINYSEQKQHRVRKNILQNTATSQTKNGVTFTVNSDGSVTCNGTASDAAWFVLNKSFDIYAPDGRIASIGNNGSTSTFYMNISYVGNVTSSLNFSRTIHQNVYVQLVIAAGYTCENLTFYPMIRKADIEDDTYEPYIENTELDVTIPALPTLSGTNTLSVNTNIKPSKVWGGLNDPRDILYVKDKLGNILFSKYYEIEDEPPLTYKAKKTGTLKDYRIYGNTVNGESVGDRTGNLFSAKLTQGGYTSESKPNSYRSRVRSSDNDFVFLNAGTYTISWDSDTETAMLMYAYNSESMDDYNSVIISAWTSSPVTFSATSDAFVLVTFKKENNENIIPKEISNIMLNTGSTALPYEPYGYKVPVAVEGKNLLQNTATSQTINGVTFTVNSDGSVTCNTDENGATNNTFFSIPISLFANTLYKLSGCPSNGSNNSYRVDIRMTDTVIRDKNGTYVVDQGRGITFLLLNDIAFADVKIRIASGYVCDNLTFYPMIRKADITDDTYEPYHAPVTTPIYLPEQIRKVGDDAEYIDYGEQKQHRLRKNLLQNTATSKTINGVTFTVNDDGSVTCNGTSDAIIQYNINTASLFNITENVILSGCPSSGASSTFFLRGIYPFDNTTSNDNGNGVLIDRIGEQMRVQIRIASGYTCNNLTFYPMIRKASIEDGTYEPYIEDTNVDVTLPALPTLSGTNTLSVETEVQPSDIYLKGKIEKKPKIYYYSQDGQTLLYTESVLKGSNGMYSGTPTKMADPQYTYTFAGWSSSTGQTAATPEVRNNIQNDKNVYAAFSQTLNTYTVYFYNESDTLIETVQNVPYGGTATYTGATPTSSQAGYIFSGWSPSNTNITADTSCYAQFVDEDMYESISDTWSEIIANVSNGTYSTKYHIGDTKKIDLGTEGEVIMTIVGIDTDDLADNSGKAPITWISKQLLKTDHRMNPSYSSSTEGTGSLGGWEKTEMRSYLKETVKPLIPETVRNAIKPVKKYSRIRNASGSAINDVLTTEDVWIPSYKEVFGSDLETLGPTYSTTFPDNASRIKSKAGSSAALWWLRSAGTNRYFYYVNADGSGDITNAKVTGGVALGFCT